ncbi:MAG TPA: hypothetical protein ENI19_03260 [Candidatus Nealsonbacteria bacterium]|nr:hypothetical protein [Candidatus Nealsonbacteria bacterium]
MERKKINNIASVAIIIRASNPSQIFIELKDDGYPMKTFRRCLCPIGGNWIGEAAKCDQNPLDTVRREIMEEICLEKRTASTIELDLLGIKPGRSFYQVPTIDQIPTSDDIKILDELKQVIAEGLVPFGDYINTIPKSVLDRSDPENERDGFSALVSYWAVALDEQRWKEITALQEKFGNLSNESITLVTSVDEIIEVGVKTAFGHDRPLKEFFLCYGLHSAQQFPLINGISSQEIGKPLASYQEYLERYEILKKPKFL